MKKNIYIKGHTLKCISNKIAIIRGFYSFSLTVNKSYIIEKDSTDFLYIINDKKNQIKIKKQQVQFLFLDLPNYRKKEIKKLL